MQHIEILRALRLLRRYAVVLVLGLAFTLAMIARGGRFSTAPGASHSVPFAAMLAGAAFAGLIVATFLAPALDNEYKTAAIAFTRPISRVNLALRYFAVDALTVVVATLLGLAAALIAVAFAGGLAYLNFDRSVWDIVIVFGAATVMWYGLIVAAAALFPGRGPMIAGASWAFAFVVSGLLTAPFPAALHALIVALSYLDPIVYIGSVGDTSSPHAKAAVSVMFGQSPMSLPGNVRVLLALALGALFLTFGTQLWSKREIPA